MSDVQRFISQLDALLAEYADLAARSRHRDLSDFTPESRVLANRLQAAIDRLTVSGSTYAKQADLQRTEPTHVKIVELAGIATALRDDLNAGLWESIVELVHAGTRQDFLEMAEELLSKDYKDAAAVIAGTSLEVHLRALGNKYGVDVQEGGKPKKVETMNTELRKAAAYEALQQKHITAWLAIRNAAAHGHYQDYTTNDVRHLIDGVRDFAMQYPA
jgi:hypothetical protein